MSKSIEGYYQESGTLTLTLTLTLTPTLPLPLTLTPTLTQDYLMPVQHSVQLAAPPPGAASTSAE